MRRPTGWVAAIAGLLCALQAAGSAFADVIILKEGRKVEGKVLQKRPEIIEVEQGGPSVLYSMDEVDRIEWSDPNNPLKEQDSPAPGDPDFWFRQIKQQPSQVKKADDPSAVQPGAKVEPGSPEVAYRGYLEAMRKGDSAGAKKLVSEKVQSIVDDIKSLDAEKLKKFSQVMLPSELEVKDVRVDGGKAVLRVKGKMAMAGEAPIDGEVTLVREQGSWKYYKEEWGSKQSANGGSVTFRMSSDPEEAAIRRKAKEAGFERFGSGAEGKAAVSGSIQVERALEEKGYLRIQFNSDRGAGYFGVDIADKNLSENKAGYRLDGVVPGKYKANAMFVLEDGNINSANRDVEIKAEGETTGIDFVCNRRYWRY